MKERLLTPDLLIRNGWEDHGGVIVLKSTPRLGWYVNSHEMIVGYHTFPIIIDTVRQLAMLLKLCGLYEAAERLKKD